MILLQKFPVSGEGASKAVRVELIVFRNKTPIFCAPTPFAPSVSGFSLWVFPHMISIVAKK